MRTLILGFIFAFALAACDSDAPDEAGTPITGTFTGTVSGQPASLTLPRGPASLDADRDGTPETYTVTGGASGTSTGGTLALNLSRDGVIRYTLGGETRTSAGTTTLRASLVAVDAAPGPGLAVVLTSTP